MPIWPNHSITTNPVEVVIRKRLEKDGLSVDMIPTKQVFAPDEPLSFTVIYRNVGKHAFRLPDQPGLYNNWELTLTWVRGPANYMSMRLMGKSSLPRGVATPARPTAPLEPGKTLAVEVKLDSYMYLVGKGDSAKAIKRHYPGKYKVNFDIHFPVKPAPDGNPVPLWPDDSIPTNPAEFEVHE